MKHSAAELVRSLEGAVRVGAAALLEDCPEGLDAALDPLLLQQSYSAHGKTLMRLAEQELEARARPRLCIMRAPRLCIMRMHTRPCAQAPPLPSPSPFSPPLLPSARCTPPSAST